MQRMKALLNTEGISLYFLDLDCDGYYDSTNRVILINQNLSELDALKSIYHELGHGVLHDDLEALYKLTIPRSKMEYEADCFMLDQLLIDYMEVNDLMPRQVNPIYFIESSDLDFKYERNVKDLLCQHILDEFELIYA
ncbi:ImmA/IrrE family metallo-endopeptidase [Enterococcus sp. AZ046]|uniref:ImmA/IrrE family metallo-endopeptidase n=1 Tax=Enterococcus sp. AZ046 TaxID=2774685 RepID=UPI003D2850E6